MEGRILCLALRWLALDKFLIVKADGLDST